MADPPGVAVGQQVGQCSVDGRARLAEDACQLRLVDERHPTKGVEQLSFRERQVKVLISWVVPRLFKRSNRLVRLLRYVVLSPVGHVGGQQRLEELSVVRNP